VVYEVDQDGNACEGERHAKRHGNMRYETRTLGAPHRAQHKKTIDEGCNESAKHNLIAPVAHEVAQQTRAELGRCKLKSKHCDGEGEPRHGNHGARDGRQDRPRALRPKQVEHAGRPHHLGPKPDVKLNQSER